MPGPYSSSVEVRFLDYDLVLDALRCAAAEAKARHPEILRVFLLGSLVRGDYTAGSDADLIVVVRRDFSCILDRSPYQIYTRAIPTDSVVYSEREFEELSRDPSSFLARNLSGALEL
jgi:predicted nucleotidyltransferase